ncbi:hypothetical protein EXT46_05375 [Pseudoalteromonas sp. CO325X]|uniref:hypothetical protein n=1 Tax=Pseudoalteromonas sp. CO325X TaxID=1777262 RepID=UPI0010230214|nr:hypothetical protein [Pseudoalteromonas sp. CO325X]RZF83725.1 hypothetical protein EXT46_05375 [Pseudoalteromonas sp. CO325X]
MADNWQWSYDKGRTTRIENELAARMNQHPFNPDDIPLHSHDGTMQSQFSKGWQSVSEVDIRVRLDRLNHGRRAPLRALNIKEHRNG